MQNLDIRPKPDSMIHLCTCIPHIFVIYKYFCLWYFSYKWSVQCIFRVVYIYAHWYVSVYECNVQRRYTVYTCTQVILPRVNGVTAPWSILEEYEWNLWNTKYRQIVEYSCTEWHEAIITMSIGCITFSKQASSFLVMNQNYDNFSLSHLRKSSIGVNFQWCLCISSSVLATIDICFFVQQLQIREMDGGNCVAGRDGWRYVYTVSGLL